MCMFMRKNYIKKCLVRVCYVISILNGRRSHSSDCLDFKLLNNLSDMDIQPIGWVIVVALELCNKYQNTVQGVSVSTSVHQPFYLSTI